MPEEEALDVERLHRHLRALASPVRLRILEALREPRRAADIRLTADRERAGFGAARILSRPAIAQHLDLLEESGLVRRTSEGYVVDQGTMFHLLEDLGGLARLRPVVAPPVEETRMADARERPSWPPRPRLLVVGGPEEGRTFGVAGDGPWEIGRGPECAVRIDLDLELSRRQARVLRAGDGYAIEVNAGAKNPVHVDRERVPPGRAVALRPGAVVEAGASRLVFQA